MSAILLAEQSIPSALRLEEHLRGLGFQVTSVADADIVDMVKLHPFDMIIWAVEHPDASEKAKLGQIHMFSDAPLLKIWEKGTPEIVGDTENLFDSVIGLPMETRDLMDTMNYHLREAYRKSHNMRLYQYKGLKISNGSIKKVEVNHKGLDLTVKEYMILSLLMCHRDCIYTKASLYEAVWRQPYTGDDNAVKIHISNLRSKLKKADPDETYIETVWGLGYRLCKN